MTKDSSVSDWTLTQWEFRGLEAPFNLADGHAQHALQAQEADFIRSLGDILVNSDPVTLSRHEQRFLDSFFALTGQSPPRQRPILHYSSSISIDVVAKSLVASGVRRVGVICPSFDNIPLLLQRAGLATIPLREPDIWLDPGYQKSAMAGCDAAFLVVPNNPTGFLPEPAAFLSLCEAAAAGHTAAVFDFSFRLLSSLHQWDQYRAARCIGGLSFACIEDTGKVYPLKEIKIGMVSASDDLAPLIREISEEIALGVSPFALRAITGLLELDLLRAGSSGHRAPTCAQSVQHNRDYLRAAIRDLPFSLAAPGSQISVEWLRLQTGGGGTDLCRYLVRRGVAILPGRPFCWDRIDEDSFVRVALAREPEYFATGVDLLAQLMEA
ncbi:aminotransferase class I/II-fold pyridoxal phosphate-dependent enzyme [Acrocarpospora sp. B8E8]|uniref:aminotransferase class I/II-fold pyridoxal phosphate-dependent enzyme n=1 Tax=Acrocarpospora sp. B8E8 TaxID=3153572 RepID=UPI00325E3143